MVTVTWHTCKYKVHKHLCDTFATHFCHVGDITDADCWAQNGSTHDLVFPIPNKPYGFMFTYLVFVTLIHWLTG